jgi:hypothetical protein
MDAAAFLRHRRDIWGSEQFAMLLLDAAIPLFNVSVPSAFDHLAVGAIHVTENGGMGIARVGFNCGIGRMVGLGNCGWIAGFGFGEVHAEPVRKYMLGLDVVLAQWIGGHRERYGILAGYVL